MDLKGLGILNLCGFIKEMNIDFNLKGSMIRTATIEDVPTILKILNHEILTSTVVYDYKERTIEELLDWFKKKQEDNKPIIVAEQNGQVLGYGTFGQFRPWAAYQYSIEHSIYVSADYRGKGIGKSIMKELIRLAKEQGYHVMIAGIDAANVDSYQFHKKFEFEESGRLNEVGYKFGKWLDLIFMTLKLMNK